MQCPKCRLENPPEAQRCDCGYDFLSKRIEQPYGQELPRGDFRPALAEVLRGQLIAQIHRQLAQAKSPELVFHFSRRRFLAIFLPVMALILFAKLYKGWSPFEDLASDVSFLIFVTVIALLTFAGPHFKYLKLTASGLTVRYPQRTDFYPWHELRNIRLDVSNPTKGVSAPLIVFDLSDESPRRNLLRKVGSAFLGYDVSIMSHYNISPAELVVYLQEYQQHFGTKTS